jgi:predicted nucleic acid-binding protein
MSYAAVVDSSTLIALARGGVFAHLGQVFQPIFIGSRAEKECQKDPQATAALRQTQAQTPDFPIIVSLISRSRVYAPNLSAADIEGIEIALARSAILLTQDELQRMEAISTGVQVLHTFDLLDGFKHLRLIVQVRPVLEQMKRNGEHYPKWEQNRLLRRVNEPPIP